MATQANSGKLALELTTPASLINYLSGTPFESTQADVLFGGTANFIFRAHLATPYRGLYQTVVVKHDQPYVKSAPDIALDIERQVFEAEALKHVRNWVDGETNDAIVTVPEVYLFDKENHTMIMEDCGTDLLTLKDFLMSFSSAAFSLAPSIGSHLGAFLARMHHWSRSNPAGILDQFRANEFGKNISAWATYGRLVETLSGVSKLPRLQDPPLKVLGEDLKVVGEVADAMQQRIKAASDLFVMGDFYPGNIMVVLDPEAPNDNPRIKRIYIFDWELAKLGIPGVELGQFCAEMIQLQRFAKDTSQVAPVASLLNRFLASYASTLKGLRDSAANGTQLAQDTLTHCGNHLIAWTPRTPTWEDKEICRKVVLEGVDLIVGVHKGDEAYLQGSFARDLL